MNMELGGLSTVRKPTTSWLGALRTVASTMSASDSRPARDWALHNLQPLARVHQRWLAFAITFIAYMTYLLTSADRTFWGDARGYWGSVTSYSLNEYTLSYRGYWFPYFCFLIRRFAAWLHSDPQVVFWTLSSTLMATQGAIIVPSLVEATVPECKPGFWKIAAFNLLVFLFFRGYSSYPLTDMPAVCALLAALWLSQHSALGLMPGIMLGLAVNSRPVYLIAALPVAFLVFRRVLSLWCNARRKAALVHSLGFLIGLSVVLGPQVYINKHNFDRVAFMPPTEVVFHGDLYITQMRLGIGMQKVEGNIGDKYPDPMVNFMDPAAKALGASNSVETYAQILKLYAKHPIESAAIFTRHLFNGLDVKFPTVYLENPYAKNWWLSLLNYSIIFAFFSVCRNVFRLQAEKTKLVAVLAAPILVTIAAIPTRVEVRYFIPFYLLMYAVVTMGGSANSRRWEWTVSRAVMFLAFLAVCCTLSEDAYANIYFPNTAP
jgi:hypothetical protein